MRFSPPKSSLGLSTSLATFSKPALPRTALTASLLKPPARCALSQLWSIQSTTCCRLNRGPLPQFRTDRSRQLVELRFAAFLEDGEIRQRVDPGNASDRVASDSDVVRFSVGGDLLKNLVLNTSVVTPNGDGINDGLRLSVHVVNVLEPRPLCLRLYDLSGRIAYERCGETRAGELVLVWDGRDHSGKRVVPGAYIAALRIEGDAREHSVQRTFAVAY